MLLFDQQNNLIDWECTDVNGEADFDRFEIDAIAEGVYTVTATDSASEFDGIYPCGNGDNYETQSATISYNVFEDYPWINDDLDPVDGHGDPDVILHLDPAAPAAP